MSLHTVQAHGARIPCLGLGTFRLTGEHCVQAVGTALRAGYRHIDTGARYGNEAEVGQAVKESGIPRSEVFITSKVYWTDIADGPLQRSAEASLKRLDVDAIDLLLIHWPNPAIPLEDTIRALNEVHRRGLTRHIGVANFTTRHIETAVALSDAPLTANECEYHPYLDQSKVLDACRRNGMAFISYTPLCKATPGGLIDDPILKDIAARKGVGTTQVVLRWHIQQPGVIAIPKAGSPTHIEANIDLEGFELTPSEMSTISALARADGRQVSPAHAPAWD
ncbi:MAG: hypothetical protein RLZ98_2408 [Pseudomonadota bacterium]|jgi:diketogulonate reductase-like aldo/keto reductase